MEALKPFLVDNYKQEPEPFPYLRHEDRYNFDVDLTVAIKPKGATVPSTGSSDSATVQSTQWIVNEAYVQRSVTNNTPCVTALISHQPRDQYMFGVDCMICLLSIASHVS
jgi:hypothetical protein